MRQPRVSIHGRETVRLPTERRVLPSGTGFGDVRHAPATRRLNPCLRDDYGTDAYRVSHRRVSPWRTCPVPPSSAANGPHGVGTTQTWSIGVLLALLVPGGHEPLIA